MGVTEIHREPEREKERSSKSQREPEWESQRAIESQGETGRADSTLSPTLWSTELKCHIVDVF